MDFARRLLASRRTDRNISKMLKMQNCRVRRARPNRQKSAETCSPPTEAFQFYIFWPSFAKTFHKFGLEHCIAHKGYLRKMQAQANHAMTTVGPILRFFEESLPTGFVRLHAICAIKPQTLLFAVVHSTFSSKRRCSQAAEYHSAGNRRCSVRCGGNQGASAQPATTA